MTAWLGEQASPTKQKATIMAHPVHLNALAARRIQATPFALWRLGFRPFYLVASIFAALAVPLWVAEYTGSLEGSWIAGPMGHAHEMLFGFALAVMSGFLLTAVRNWSGRPTATGPALALLVAVWLAARVLALTPLRVAPAVVDVAFPLAIAVAIAIPLVQSGNRRNYFFPGLFVVLAALDLVFQLARLGVAGVDERYAIQGALDVVLIVMTVMGGRVIPMFTTNGVPGSTPQRRAVIERASPLCAAALLVVDLVPAPLPLRVAVLVLGALTLGTRALLWRPWQTLRAPLVWVLHAGYLWIPVYMALRAAAEVGWIPLPIATHALTAGAIGMLTIGMMTRTARGHSGRPLVADRFETGAYLLIAAAAVTRVFVPLLVPAVYVEAIVVSGCLWSAGFAVYAVRYWPVLTRPRLDGKPG